MIFFHILFVDIYMECRYTVSKYVYIYIYLYISLYPRVFQSLLDVHPAVI